MAERRIDQQIAESAAESRTTNIDEKFVEIINLRGAGARRKPFGESIGNRGGERDCFRQLPIDGELEPLPSLRSTLITHRDPECFGAVNLELKWRRGPHPRRGRRQRHGLGNGSNHGRLMAIRLIAHRQGKRQSGKENEQRIAERNRAREFHAGRLGLEDISQIINGSSRRTGEPQCVGQQMASGEIIRAGCPVTDDKRRVSRRLGGADVIPESHYDEDQSHPRQEPTKVCINHQTNHLIRVSALFESFTVCRRLPIAPLFQRRHKTKFQYLFIPRINEIQKHIFHRQVRYLTDAAGDKFGTIP